SSRRDRICNLFRQGRAYIGFTPSGGTTNDRALVWNEHIGGVESEDYLKQTNLKWEMGFIYNAAAGSVSASRILFFHTDGSLHAHEESLVDDEGTAIAHRLWTGYFGFDNWQMWFIEDCQARVSQNPGKNLTVGRIS